MTSLISKVRTVRGYWELWERNNSLNDEKTSVVLPEKFIFSAKFRPDFGKCNAKYFLNTNSVVTSKGCQEMMSIKHI